MNIVQLLRPAVLLAALLIHGVSLADESAIGYVKTVTGKAWVDAAGRSQQAAPGLALHAGARLRTEAASTLGVTLKDNTVLSFGPDTDFTIDEFAYAPVQGQLGLAVSLARGTLSYISGLIAKLRPEGVSVKTPSGVIGVRGTEFVAKVEPTK